MTRQVDSDSVTLSQNESYNSRLTWDTSDTESGTYTVTVQGAGDSYSFTVAVEEIVDDFEDNNISEYTGDTGAFSTVQSPVQNGNYSLEYDASGQEIFGTGLSTKPSRGETLKYYGRTTTNNDRCVTYFYVSNAVKGSVDGYGLAAPNTRGDTFQLNRYDSGSATSLASKTFDFVIDKWYEVTVKSTSSDLTVELRDEAGTLLETLSATDNTHSGSDIGFRGVDSSFGGENHYWDNIRKI